MLAAFSIAFVGTLLIALLQGVRTFYFDSGAYWALGSRFTDHGFSLLNFNSPLRGYLLPLIDHGLQSVADALRWKASSMAKLFNVLAFSLIGAVLAPRFAEMTWPAWRWGIGRRLVLTAMLIVFWSGYLNFPLSDFPALTMTLLAFIAIAHPETPTCMGLAGLASGAAIDMRPSYLLLAPILIVLVIWTWVERKGGDRQASAARRTLCITLLVAGFLIVSLPQSLAAHRHFHTWSFVPGSPIHLTTLQLTEGLRLQRYETFVGKGHGPQMRYEDAAGVRLLNQQHNQITSAGQYLGLIFYHPVTTIGLFFRHVVNGLDQRYSTPYVEHLDTGSHRWLRLAGFLLIFLGLLRLLWSTARQCLGMALWRYPVSLALCCLTSVPSAIETRYLLPVFLLSYILMLLPRWPNPFSPAMAGVRIYRTPAIILGAYLVFMAIVWPIVANATNHLRLG